MKRIIFLLITMTLSLYAETFNVSTTAEFRAALSSASSNEDTNDTINLATGIYRTTDDGGLSSFSVNDVTLIGSTTGETVLDGNNTHTVITGSNSRLENIIVSNGNNIDSSNRGAGIVGSGFIVINCKIIHNHAEYWATYGSAVWGDENSVINTLFYDNTDSNYGQVYGSNIISINSIYIDGDRKAIYDEGVYDNTLGEYIASPNGILQNNIFINNSLYLQYGNAVEINNTTYATSDLQNLFVDFDNENYLVKPNSALIDAGTTDTNGTVVPNVDMVGNTRTLGLGIDIGPYEYEKVESISLQLSDLDDVKVNHTSSVSIITSVLDGYSVSELYIDNGDGVYTLVDNNTSSFDVLFELEGNYTIRVKAIDNITEVFEVSKIVAVEANTAPVINSFVENNDTTNNIFIGSIIATDEDNDTLSYTLSGDDASLFTITNSGELSFNLVPSYENPIDLNKDNIYTFYVVVDDSFNGSVSKNIMLQVYDGSYKVAMYEPIVYNPDAPSTLITYTVEDGLPISVTQPLNGEVTLENNMVNFTPDADFTGSTTFYIAFDTDGGVVFKEYNFFVENTNVEIPMSVDEAINFGKNYVQDNLAEFSLVTVETMDQATQSAIDKVVENPSDYGLVSQMDMNTSVTEAFTNGTVDGKKYVQDNLAEFGLISQLSIELTPTRISTLSSGWSLVSTPVEITDLSIFDSAKIIWIYNNSVWSAYSSNSDTQVNIEAKEGVELIIAIPAGSGIWVEK